jgi:hypothetical protein
VGVAFCVLTASAHAGGGAATDSYAGIGSGGVDAHGVADAYEQLNLTAPLSRTLAVRAYDAPAGQPSVGLLRLTLAHKPEVFGFRVDVGVGDLPDAYLRFDPAASTHPGLSRVLSYAEQAFVTAKVPVGRGLDVDIGKFGTPIGLEDNEALSNWNYSRSLLFLLAEPSYHSGLRLTYCATDSLSATLLWLNGWDTNIFEGNGMRTLAGAITWNATSSLTLVADAIVGPERPPTRLYDPSLSLRSAFDVYAQYALTPGLTVAYTADYGRDAAGGGASWWGLAGYVRAQPLPWLSGTLRGEHYADGDGFTSGIRQRMVEMTATLEVRGELHHVTWVERLEIRRDQSDAAFFGAAAAPTTHQDTIGLSAIAAF